MGAHKPIKQGKIAQVVMALHVQACVDIPRGTLQKKMKPLVTLLESKPNMKIHIHQNNITGKL